jgi:hypothetical protein
MKSLGYNKNLVCMLGYVQNPASERLLVLEYCVNGNLLDFVRKNKTKFVDVSFLWSSYYTIRYRTRRTVSKSRT